MTDFLDDKLEPGVRNAEISSAISLKRIADSLADVRTLEMIHESVKKLEARLDHRNYGAPPPASAHSYDLLTEYVAADLDPEDAKRYRAVRASNRPGAFIFDRLGINGTRTYAEDAAFVAAKQTSPEVSALAAKYLAMDDHALMNAIDSGPSMAFDLDFDKLGVVLKDIKTLAAAVSQDVTK